MRRIFIAMANFAAVGAALAAQAHAVKVGDGALFTFRIAADDGEGMRSMLAEVDGTGPAAEFWREAGEITVVHRLDRAHLLLADRRVGMLFVLDLDSGQHHGVADGDAGDFVAQHGDDVLLLHRGRFSAVAWRTDAPPRHLGDRAFARIAVVAGNLAIAVDDEPRAAWSVSLTTGCNRRLRELPATPQSPRLALSPNGQRLAIASVDDHGNGRLLVVDPATGGSLREWHDLPIDVPPESSSMPTLEVAWFDDDHIAASESRGARLRPHFVTVVRDWRNDDIDERDPIAAALWHSPPTPSPPPEPLFRLERGATTTTLWRTGTEAPLAAEAHVREQFGDLWLAPDGVAAVARLGERKNRLTLFAAATAPPRELATGWAQDYRWLPPMAP